MEKRTGASRHPREPKKRSNARRIFLGFAIVVAVMFVGIGCGFLTASMNTKPNLTDDIRPPASSQIYDINGNEIDLAEEDLLIDTAQTEGFETQSDSDLTVVLDKTLTPELIEEGFVRELISKIQTMRKEAGFEVMDRISVYAQGNEKIQKIMEDNAEEIRHDVLADSLSFDAADGYVKEWKINGETVTLGVKKN